MKKITVFFAVFISALYCSAAKKPQLRACENAGGEYFVVEFPEDEIAICQFGVSYVGAIDFLNRDALIEIPLSLHYYKKGVTGCAPRNLTLISVSENHNVSVCLYSDGSVIDIETLKTGRLSEHNTQLDSALGVIPNLRFHHY